MISPASRQIETGQVEKRELNLDLHLDLSLDLMTMTMMLMTSRATQYIGVQRVVHLARADRSGEQQTQHLRYVCSLQSAAHPAYSCLVFTIIGRRISRDVICPAFASVASHIKARLRSSKWLSTLACRFLIPELSEIFDPTSPLRFTIYKPK